MASASDILSRVAGVVGSAAVQKVTLKTQFLPDIEMQPFVAGAPGAPAAPSSFSLMGLLKPEVIVDTPAGQIVSAPYGEPGNYFPLLIIGGGLLAVGAVVSIGWLARKFGPKQ